MLSVVTILSSGVSKIHAARRSHDGAGRPALVLQRHVHRLAAAVFVVLELLWLALNGCATDGNNPHKP